MDATFEFFNSPSNSSASSVCDDDDEDNKNVSNDSDSSAESPVPRSDPRYNSLLKVNLEIHYASIFCSRSAIV